ncbi:hypothetical protein [Sphingobacterium puteale]|nr:hypothetical protein [Sphingobacterium puteale]
MESIKIKYKQLLFLYGYLRLMDLSLDRSRWGSLSRLRSYFENIIAPFQVVEYIRKIHNLCEADLSKKNIILKSKTITERLRSLVFKNPKLKYDELLYSCKLLTDFENILLAENEVYTVEMEKLRIDIAVFYSEVLGKLIRYRDLKKLMRIQHFQQSEYNKTIELSNFIPNDFESVNL